MNKTIISHLHQIFKSSVSAVMPEILIRNTLKYDSGTQQLYIAGKIYNLKDKNVYVIGTGKAVQTMANEVEDILSNKIIQGIISIPLGSRNNKLSVQNSLVYCEGGKNNLPDSLALATATKIKELICRLTDNDFLLVLISGGGSALMPLPKGSITLEEKTTLIKKLANSGANIQELNTVRKRISDLKGGQLAILAQPAMVVSLILSDIVGDPLDLIASGPTCENKDDTLEALKIIQKYGLSDQLSESVKSILMNSQNENSFPNGNVQNIVIGSNKLSIEACVAAAKNLSYAPIIISSIVTGDINNIALEYAKLVNILIDYRKDQIDLTKLKDEVKTFNIPGLSDDFLLNIDNELIKNGDLCIILGGEITVKVKGLGKGGRNQQLALEFSKQVHKIKSVIEDHDIYFLSAGTDGIDGPTDVAGAIGYLNLISESKNDNIDVESYMSNNDSYNFYKAFKNGELHINTGHTNTNVMDIHLIIIKKCF